MNINVFGDSYNILRAKGRRGNEAYKHNHQRRNQNLSHHNNPPISLKRFPPELTNSTIKYILFQRKSQAGL